VNLYAHVQHFLMHVAHETRMQRASGLPRALCLEGAKITWKTSGESASRAAKLRPLCFDIDFGNAQIGPQIRTWGRPELKAS